MTGYEDLLKAIREALDSSTTGGNDAKLYAHAAAVRGVIGLVVDAGTPPDAAAAILRRAWAYGRHHPPQPIDDLMATVAEIKAERGERS